MPENTQHEPGPLCNEECQPGLSELREQTLADLNDTSTTTILDAFREGMSAGLDFAYRVVEDYEAQYGEDHVITAIKERLVSEHDMRSEQPIRAIRAERATAQASDAMLADLREALTAVEERNQEEVRAENTETIRESIRDMRPTCDGPCCRPEADPDNVFDWVNVIPGHGLPEVQINPRALEFGPAPAMPEPTPCTCGRFRLVDPEGTVMAPAPGGAMRHLATAPCYVVASYDEEDELS